MRNTEQGIKLDFGFDKGPDCEELIDQLRTCHQTYSKAFKSGASNCTGFLLISSYRTIKEFIAHPYKGCINIDWSAGSW